MIQSIIDGIVKTLKQEFGCRIYTELPSQNLKEPSFYVKCVTPTITPKLRKRVTNAYTFNIMYYPKDKVNPSAECLNVSEIASDVLQSISTAIGVVHAQDSITSSSVDNALQIKVVYSIYAMKDTEKADEMETLEHNVEVR